MSKVEKKWVYRIIHIQNLKYDLQEGLYSKQSAKRPLERIHLGSKEIINLRDRRMVDCYPETYVNQYVPFYFSVRTPMLFNIITGLGVQKRNQREIVYLCCKLRDLANENFQWCFTDGNATVSITKFFDDLDDIHKLDWHSIFSEDFRIDNADRDNDRIRKKQAEFLVRNYVPSDKIKSLVVLDNYAQDQVQRILDEVNMSIPIHVNPKNKFYFK